MFIDYYSLLEIEGSASFEEIRKAFRKQAIKWHPDRNHGRDTTTIMQLLNEAYLILKDTEARCRYNKEYLRFRSFQEQKKQEDTKKEHSKKETAESTDFHTTESSSSKDNSTNNQEAYEHNEYSIKDETLKRWIANAKKQAYEMAKETLKEFGNIASVGIKEGVRGAGHGLIIQLVIGVIVLIVFSISKSCT